jgi:dihydrofolate reductase
VVSSRALDDPPPGVELWQRPIAELVDRLRATSRDCWLVGGARLIQGFAELDAVDEYRLFTMPLVLGTGTPLFAEDFPAQRLERVETRMYGNGVVCDLLRPRRRVG